MMSGFEWARARSVCACAGEARRLDLKEGRNEGAPPRKAASRARFGRETKNKRSPPSSSPTLLFSCARRRLPIKRV
jgi:hypothetical protein